MTYNVRACSRNCGYDASHQPLEITRCPNCNGIIVSMPVSFIEEFRRDIPNSANVEDDK